MERRDDHENQLNNALREHFESENAGLNALSRASFARVHAQLMTTIDADCAAADGEAELFPAPAMLVPRTAPPSQFSSAGRLGWRVRPMWKLAGALSLTLFAGWSGHRVGRNSVLGATEASAAALPIAKLENDFDAQLHASAPVEFVSEDNAATATWLSQQTGRRVRLPRLAAPKSDVKLLGASRHQLRAWNGHAVAQAHYIVRGGARATLYLLCEPHLGLTGMRETQIRGKRFFVQNEGRYRTVVWRSDDDLVAMVSSLGEHRALQLAVALRASLPDDLV